MRSVIALLVLVAAASADDVAVLTRGVGAVGVPGVPGPLGVIGKRAFPVVCALADGQPVPIVAAARWGGGRVVAFGHGGYLGRVLTTADTGRLLLNAVRWAGRADRPRVGVHKLPFVQQFLARAGIDAVTADGPRGFDAYVAPPSPDLRDYVRGGGGLVTASLGWGWKQLNPGKDLATEHPGNALLAEAGLLWCDGYIKVPRDKRLAVAPPPPLTHAQAALAALRDKRPPPLAAATLGRVIADLPPEDTHLLPRLRKLPAPSRPPYEGLDKVALATRIRLDRYRLPRANPAAEQFPGAVARGAKRVRRTLTVDTAIPDWHSTGLYAPPGGVVVVSTRARGLKLRIGAHKDRLWNKKTWRRAPEITRVFALEADRTEVVHAFGGLLYVVVPRGRNGVAEIDIDGAVEAPYYVHGRTDAALWRKTLRRHPAPWGELATGKVILTLPSSVLRALDDPAPLMDFWDRVLDACADLATTPRERARPERYVADEQISAGYMHAGYPIMTHMDAAPRFVDLPTLSSKGDWGMFHEMGHNHQHGDWTFDGTGEVTVNLFSLYVMETVCGAPGYHGQVTQRARLNLRGKYDAAGRDFAQWKRQPFLALVSYIELQEAFGWDTYKKVFATYRDLPKAQRPKDDAEKRDQWMVRYSRAAGRNLAPFFESWGIPTSERARDSIADLPAWNPSKR